MSKHSVTKYELHEEAVIRINENIAAGFPPLEMFTRWSGQTPQWDPGNWRHPLQAGLAGMLQNQRSIVTHLCGS